MKVVSDRVGQIGIAGLSRDQKKVGTSCAGEGACTQRDGALDLRQAAHDLRGLLQLIVGCTDTMLRTPGLPNPIQAVTEQICTAVDHCGQILDSLRPRGSSRDAVGGRSAIGVEVKRVARFMEDALPRHLRFEVKVEPGEHVVNASPMDCKRAVMNLVLNARDAVGDGGWIEVRVARCATDDPVARALGPSVRLSVADNGSGIPPEVQPHLFRPGFTSKSGGGRHGLGLNQVRKFAEGAGGTVVCNSAQGVGTRFDVYLPLLKCLQPPQGAAGHWFNSPSPSTER